jgi:hypothetical protein
MLRLPCRFGEKRQRTGALQGAPRGEPGTGKTDHEEQEDHEEGSCRGALPALPELHGEPSLLYPRRRIRWKLTSRPKPPSNIAHVPGSGTTWR